MRTRIAIRRVACAAMTCVVGCSLGVDEAGVGKACDEGRCAPGYVCDETTHCVLPSTVGDSGTTGTGGAASSDVPPGNGGAMASPSGSSSAGATTRSMTGGASGIATRPGRDAALEPDGGGLSPTSMDASKPPDSEDAGCASPHAYYRDADGDGFGSDVSKQFCGAPVAGWVTMSGDCDDAEKSVFPGQTAYFGTPYSKSGIDSFDYDCSGREEPDPATAGAAPDCPALELLLCTGAGFATSGRTGTGVDPTCGSAELLTCAGLLACTPTRSMVTPKACR